MRRALGACAWGGETRCGERKRMRQNEGRQVTSSFYTSPFKAEQASSGAMTAMSGQITITAIRGINLAAKDVGGSSDPYYILKCAGPHLPILRLRAPEFPCMLAPRVLCHFVAALSLLFCVRSLSDASAPHLRNLLQF